MKIAYLTMGFPDPSDAANGIFRKVLGQMSYWRQAGHDVYWYALASNPNLSSELKNVPFTPLWSAPSHSGRFRVSPSIFRRMVDAAPDMVYMRFGSYYPRQAWMMKQIPTFLELNSDDLSEYRAMLPRYQFLFHTLTRAWTLNAAAGLVATTHAIARRFVQFNKPTLVMANSIDMSQYVRLPAPNNPQPRLIFIALNHAPWNGVESVVDLARAFPTWHIDVIGQTGLEKQTDLPTNITLHGLLTKQKYDGLMHAADIAIGTMALHRKQMDEACALKVREYFAYGLPMILAYTDTDFSDGAPFMLQLPNADNNVLPNVAKIEAFVQAWKGRRVPYEAVKHIDTPVKEAQRLAFFEQTLQLK